MPTQFPSSLTTSRALTVYNDGFALVKETRTIPAIGEDGIIHYLDVAQLIETNSLIIEGLTVRELNYEFDLVDKYKLLEKYIGRELTITDLEMGEVHTYRLLSASNGFVMEDVETNEIVLDPKGEMRLPELPEGLLVKPTLVWHIANQTSDEVHVSYLTRGISWEADYVIAFRENRFDVTGWVTLTNHSGMAYEDTSLRLIAGTVNRVDEPMMRVMYESSAPMDQPEHQSFSDFHMYSIQGLLTVKDKQQKQVQLLTAKNAIARTIYEVKEHQKHPTIYIEFDNTEANALGFPLPKGNVKMYRDNPADGTMEFIGEDRIGHTASNETVRLKSGEAFDITSESGTVDTYKQGMYEFEVIEYELRNAKNESVEVTIRHAVHENNWTVEDASHSWERKYDEVILPVSIPANGKEKIRFTIRYDCAIRIKPE